MASRHLDIFCKHCRKASFTGRRYKCLICYDYDLCSTCYDQQIHPQAHPMQLILTKDDYEEIYFNKKDACSSLSSRSLTCPFCAMNGFTQNLFIEHVQQEHPWKKSVVCPICLLRQSHLAEHLDRHREKNEIESMQISQSTRQGLLHRLLDEEHQQEETHPHRSTFLHSLLIQMIDNDSIEP